jgi:hypothetical protein
MVSQTKDLRPKAKVVGSIRTNLPSAFGQHLIQPIVTCGNALLHSGCERHITGLFRWIQYCQSECRLFVSSRTSVHNCSAPPGTSTQPKSKTSVRTIRSGGVTSRYTPCISIPTPSGPLHAQRNFPPTRKSFAFCHRPSWRSGEPLLNQFWFRRGLPNQISRCVEAAR